MHWLEYRGNDKREYKNALAFVVPSSVQMDKVLFASRTKLALASLLEQKQKYKFTAEDIEELKAKEKTSLADLNAALRKLYQEVFIGVPNTDSSANNPLRLENIDLQSQINVSDKLQEKVLEALKNHVFDSLTVNKLIRLANLTPDKPYLKVNDLISYFFRFPSYPKLISSQPIVRAIALAIEQGKLGYTPNLTIPNNNLPVVENPSLISYQKSIPIDELDINGYLLTPELVEQLQQEEKNKIANDTATEEELYKTSTTTNLRGKESTETNEYKTGETSNDVIVEKTTNSSIEKTIRTSIINIWIKSQILSNVYF